MAKITLFAQIAQHLPKNLIKKAIRELGTDKHAKGFDTWSHLVSMVFCQFAGCGSLRDISNRLKSATGNPNHLGISRAPSKSTLSYQNEHRGSAVFKEIYYRLFEHFGQHERVLRGEAPREPPVPQGQGAAPAGKAASGHPD